MKIGIVGTGTMGAGIAQVAAQAGHEVLLYDAQALAGQQALSRIDQALQREVEKGKIRTAQATEALHRLAWVDRLDKFRSCDWVVEAIVEDLSIKQELFRQLEQVVSTSCVLATNTSSLSVSAIAASCQHPERVLGIHFFNPVPLMALVELIPAVQSRPSLLEECRAELLRWNKQPVLAKDTPGFIVNRVARPFYTEALRIYDEGIADCASIDAAMCNLGGFRMGPFQLMDFIGHDVNFRVTESLYLSCYHEPRYRPSLTQKRLFEAGYLGRKSGKGFYDYQQALPQPSASPSVQQEIFTRIMVMLVNEAADALLFKLATREDIDLAMQKGMNFPQGPLQWAESWGIARCIQQLDQLYDYYHEDRYRCSAGLRQLSPA